MEGIENLNDFYIDLDGDIKATVDDRNAKFITKTDKCDSQYVMAESVDEIQKAIAEINQTFKLDNPNILFKQYSIKRDSNGDKKAIKIFIDQVGDFMGLDTVLMGIEISKDKLYGEYYFIGSSDKAREIVKEKNLNYKIFDYDTHKPILYALKYELDSVGRLINAQPVNFKTYYVKNESAAVYNMDFANHLKQSLKFS